MCAKFVNNYSPDFDGEKAHQGRLATDRTKPLGFESDEHFSRALSSLLRHQALRAKIKVHPGGYVDIPVILRHFGDKCTEEDIERVVIQDQKQRYHIRKDDETGRLQIRANQGHTFPIEDDGSLLTEIHHEAGLSEVTHGTTPSAWLTIRAEGLKRMRRNHIHFIEGRAKSDDEMLPDYRNTSSVLVIVDIRMAILDGIQFFRSKNNVILSPGDKDGCIPIKYFKRVIDTKTNEILWPQGTDPVSLRKVTPESPVTLLCTGAKKAEAKRIKKEGLHRKQKDFITLMRPTKVSEMAENIPSVLIYVDVKKAMGQGIDFYYQDEEVFVTKGNDNGVILPKFCSKAVDTTTDAKLW